MDLIAQIAFPGWTDWRVSQTNQIQITEDETENDMFAGCYIDFTIETPFKQNICQVPTAFTDFSSTIETDMKVYDKIYMTTGTEGSTLTIPELAGKKILLLIREDNVMYLVSNLPDNTQYTFDGTNIDLGLPVQKAGERFLILYRTI